MDLISVIIPVYNTEKYLEDCLNSILNQTYKSLEIIIINDGSTDNSSQIIMKYCKEYSNITSIYQENQGLSMARNTGLKYVKGKFITFLDSDDIVDRQMLSSMMQVLKDKNAEIVYSSLKRFKILPNDYNDRKNKSFRIRVCGPKVALKTYFEQKRGNVCGGLFKRELFHNIQFPPNLIFEDNFPKTVLLLRSRRTVFMDADFYYYRITRNSITTQKFNGKKLDILKIGYMVDKYLKKHDIINFNYYKKDYYRLIYEITYDIFRESLDMNFQNYDFYKRGISIIYLYKILAVGLFSNIKRYGLLFLEINFKIIFCTLKHVLVR